MSEFRTSLEYNASTRIPQFLPATIPVFLSPAEDIRRNFAVVTHAPRYSMVFGLKKRKRKENFRSNEFFPPKGKEKGKMFRAFSKSGAPLNSNYILRKRRKGNGVIFIFIFLKKKKSIATLG